MKQGDVFTIDEKEPLFVANTVTPSGAVYARKFDVYKGAYGGTEAFQPSTEFSILFNLLGQQESFAEVKIGTLKLKDFVLLRGDSFLKQGAVFIVNGIEPLFIVDKVASSGTIYARKFDLRTGPYGGTEEFQPNSEVRILYNFIKSIRKFCRSKNRRCRSRKFCSFA